MLAKVVFGRQKTYNQQRNSESKAEHCACYKQGLTIRFFLFNGNLNRFPRLLCRNYPRLEILLWRRLGWEERLDERLNLEELERKHALDLH